MTRCGLERDLSTAKQKCLVLRQRLTTDREREEYQKAKNTYARLLRKAKRRATVEEKKRGSESVCFRALQVVYDYWFRERVDRVREDRTRRRDAATAACSRVVQNRRFVLTHAVLMRKSLKEKNEFFWCSWNYPFPAENYEVRRMMFQEKDMWMSNTPDYTVSPQYRGASPYWCLGPCRVCGTHVVELVYRAVDKRFQYLQTPPESPRDYYLVWFRGECCNPQCRCTHSLDVLLEH